MRDPNSPSLHGWAKPPTFGGGFPGIGQPGFGGDPFFSGPPGFVNPTVLPPKGFGGVPGKGGFSLADIPALIDRMGGIEGVISGITKFQKFIATMQQFAPLFRLFLSKAATKASNSSTGDGAKTKTRRKSRKRGSRPRQKKN